MSKEIVVVARNTSIVFIAKIVSYFLAIVFNIIIARKFGAEIYGNYILIYSILSIFSVLVTLGIKDGLMYYLPRLNADKNFEDNKNLTTTTLIVSFLLGLFVILLIFLLSKQLSLTVFDSIVYSKSFKILSFLIITDALTDLIRASLRSNDEIKQYALGDILLGIFRILIITIFIIIGLNENVLFLCYVSASAITLTYYLFIFKQKKLFGKVNKNSINLYKSMLLMFYPSMFTAILLLLQFKIDKIMIGAFLDDSSVGIYNIAITIANLSSFFFVVLNTIMSPLISKMYYENNLEKLSEVYKTTTKWTSSINLLFFALVLILNREFLQVFGTEFRIGAITLILVTVGQIINSSTGSSSALINMTGRVKINFYLNLIAVIINISLNIVLIPIYGINGAAFATMISIIFLNSSSVIYIYTKMNLHPFSPQMVKQIIVISASLLFSYIFYIIINLNWLGSIIIITFTMLLLYISLNWIIGFDNDDKLVFEKIKNRFSFL